ncbi:MAG: GatB/YqeY domain-containing protein [Candidatus Neomarinimicrobiota bacterium]|nr:GatB/YqeY domain-containing protein [Candidatus Neomarinimicrobiota bacterium]
MVLYEKIQSDMYTAMKDGEKEKASTLRTVLAKLKDKQIDNKEPLSEKDEIKVLQTLVKQRKESIDLYQKGGRSELAEAESFELEIINTYLPEMMNEDDVRKLIEEIIEETGAQSMADLGKVMPQIMKQGKGLIDGKTAQRIVSELLS